MIDHKVLSLDQVLYDGRTDGRRPLEQGLNALALEGWDLVTTYQAQLHTDRPITMFVFRRGRR